MVDELPRLLSGCLLSGNSNQRMQGEQCVCWGHLENCKGQGRLLQLMATLCPLSIRMFRGFWQDDTGTAAIPLVLLGKLRRGVVP